MFYFFELTKLTCLVNASEVWGLIITWLIQVLSGFKTPNEKTLEIWMKEATKGSSSSKSAGWTWPGRSPAFLSSSSFTILAWLKSKACSSTVATYIIPKKEKTEDEIIQKSLFPALEWQLREGSDFHMAHHCLARPRAVSGKLWTLIR